jgi:hypothetical protein
MQPPKIKFMIFSFLVTVRSEIHATVRFEVIPVYLSSFFLPLVYSEHNPGAPFHYIWNIFSSTLILYPEDGGNRFFSLPATQDMTQDHIPLTTHNLAQTECCI